MLIESIVSQIKGEIPTNQNKKPRATVEKTEEKKGSFLVFIQLSFHIWTHSDSGNTFNK